MRTPIARSLFTVLMLSGRAYAQLVAPTSPATSSSTAPTPEAIETARRLFREGVEAAQARRWAEARERFLRALQLYPAPIVRFNLALAYESDARLVEAIDQYRQFLRDTPEQDDPPRVNAVRAQIPVLEQRLARLLVTVTGDDVRTLRLDGREQPTALLGVEIPVDPGEHVIEVVGVAGDQVRRQGSLYEGERMSVPVVLSRTPAIESLQSRGWAARTQSFGHWVSRPGPDGRWIDWAARATTMPRSIWRERPFTLALQVGTSGIAGIGALTLRYFPQPAFGAELALGGGDAFGFTSALMAHARYPMTTFAVGIAAGLSMSLGAAQITCASTMSNMCPADRTRDVHVTTLMVPVALTGELRLGSRFALRAMLGVRVVANPVDLRTMGDRTHYGLCSDTSGMRVGLSPCGVYLETNGGSTVTPLAGVDLGYGF